MKNLIVVVIFLSILIGCVSKGPEEKAFDHCLTICNKNIKKFEFNQWSNNYVCQCKDK